jgi:putative heme transporter
VKKTTWASAVRGLLIVAICVGAVAAVYAERSTIRSGIRDLRYLNWAWVAAAILCETLSMLGMVLLYRALLTASQARLTLTWITVSSYVANAISVAVPVVGSGMGSRLAYQQFREGGADPAAASLTLTLAGIVSTVTLATVATTAAVLSGNPAASAGGLLAAVALLATAITVAVELRSERGQSRLVRFIAFSLRCSQRVIRRPKGEAQTLAKSVLASVQRLRLGKSTLAQVLLWGLINWWADVACLAFAMLAVGISHLSVGMILLVWTAGAAAAGLCPTPAGIGAVEVAMVSALAAAGVRGSYAITAILVYRLISLKGGVSLFALFHRYVYQRLRRTRT